MKGFTIYHGPSTIDGAPIVAVLTLKSENPKTGSIPQLWILPADTEPHTAAKAGADVSVCGGCPHRPRSGGSCYVILHRGPLSVYRTWQRGGYPQATTAQLAAWFAAAAPRAVRLGAYGDPLAVPFNVLEDFANIARDAGATVLGYTHRWRHPSAAPYRKLCMASVDTIAEQRDARSRGWRTFRVMAPDENLTPGERMCPALEGMTCNACRACDGMNSPDSRDVAIPVHGSNAVRKFSTWQGARR
jgi:hypothetical protein